jgi:PAS domain S-box-containing protein
MKKGKDPPAKAIGLRRQTEGRTRTATAKGSPARAHVETQQLVHELQAYQLKLETQDAALRQSRAEAEEGLARYAELYDSVPVGYMSLGRDGAIRQANLAGARLLGIERVHLIGKRFGAFVSEEDQAVFKAFLEKVFAGKENAECEVALRRKGRGPLNVQISGSVSPGRRDCRAVVTDITVRKQLENTHLFLLQCGSSASGEDFFRSLARYLAETLGMEYVCIDRLEGDGFTFKALAVYVDGRFEDKLTCGFKDTACGEAVGKTLCSFPKGVRRLFPRDAVLKELKAECYVGTTLWSSQGQPIGLIAVIGRRPRGDLSLAEAILKVVALRAAGELERRQTEAEKTENALRESQERHRILVESMNDGLAVTDENAVLTYVDTKLCKMSGYSSDEMIGRPAREWLDDANRKILDEQWGRRLKGAQDTYEIAWIRKDGTSLHTLVSPTPIFDNAGRFKGSFAVVTDITERKQSEELLRKAFAEIQTLKDQIGAENVNFRQDVVPKQHFGNIIGQSNELKYVMYRAEQVAPTNAAVLLLGETGTGKGLVAAAIHHMSPHRDRPLVTVNCAALPANLIESELFGREKGAFTGAETPQVGRFETADGSTLCLDEIGELPLDVQAKLLRVIQHNEFERLGSSRTIKVKVRIIATTNRDLEAEVRKGRFRQDLFYRINVFPITVPPLRQRKEDILPLVEHLTTHYAEKLGKQFKSIHGGMIKALQDYSWPGNIRELENVIERTVILCPGPVLQLTEKLDAVAASASSSLKTLNETEREQILKTLSQTRWRVNGKKGAAEILGIHPNTLRARMHKLGIRRPEIKTLD